LIFDFSVQSIFGRKWKNQEVKGRIRPYAMDDSWGLSVNRVADHKCLKGFAIIGSGLATLVSKVLGFEGIYGFTLITNGVSTTTLGHLGCTKPVCPG
jgi:hypothetical protein